MIQGGLNLRWYKLLQEDAADRAGPVVPVVAGRQDRTGNPATVAVREAHGTGDLPAKGPQGKRTPAGSRKGWYTPAA